MKINLILGRWEDYRRGRLFHTILTSPPLDVPLNRVVPWCVHAIFYHRKWIVKEHKNIVLDEQRKRVEELLHPLMTQLYEVVDPYMESPAIALAAAKLRLNYVGVSPDENKIVEVKSHLEKEGHVVSVHVA